MSRRNHVPFEDPLSWVPDILTKLWTIWLRTTYPFNRFGKDVSIHYTCDVRRCIAKNISIGDDVILAKGVRLNVPEPGSALKPTLVIGDHCSIGRYATISAKNYVRLEEWVGLAAHSFVTDHNHVYEDLTVPICNQGTTDGGTVIIERNCWLGYGSAVVAGTRKLVLGQTSVVGANALVTHSHPAYSVLIGNPAQVVKKYDPVSGKWILRLVSLNEKGHEAD
jgi:acetyltransferase-like isoleucine patch superfamily enzyme